MNEAQIQAGGAILSGSLSIPENTNALVLFAHGSGSGRHSPRNQFVARTLNQAGLATLLFDLLTCHVFECAPVAQRIEHLPCWSLNGELRSEPIEWTTLYAGTP